MPLVTRIRKRGVNMVIEANGEVLFGPTGPVGSFTRSLSNKIRGFTIQAAPTNKRPRWGHYGLPLKRTFKASTRYDPIRMRVDAVVGSTAAHAAAVDQGTGVYNGGAPYEAKILPPWTHGGPSLYERTWIPPGGKRGAPVMIRGQKGQHFFDKGLEQGFAAARLASIETPGTTGAASSAIESVPNELTNFLANTVASGAFIAQLTEWRAWRDAVWGLDSDRSTRRGTNVRTGRKRRLGSSSAYKLSPEARRARAAARSKKYRDNLKARNGTANTMVRDLRAELKANRRTERERFLAAANKKYPGNVELQTLEFHDGYYFVAVRYKNSRGKYEFKEIRGRKID